MANDNVYATYYPESVVPIRVNGVDTSGAVVVHCTVDQARNLRDQLDTFIEHIERTP